MERGSTAARMLKTFILAELLVCVESEVASEDLEMEGEEELLFDGGCWN
jgi:hypothetical protein